MYRLSLHTRLALATLLLAAAATVVAVVGASWWSYERALSAGEVALQQSVLLLDRSVNRSTAMLRDRCQDLITDVDQGAAPDQMTTRLRDIVATTDHVMLAELVDRSGTVVAASDPDRVGQQSNGQNTSLVHPGHSHRSAHVTLASTIPSGQPSDPLARLSDTIAVNIAGDIYAVNLYIDARLFHGAINGITTWKNQVADLIHVSGVPLIFGPAAWHRPVRMLAAGEGAALHAVSPNMSASLRTDDWLIAHRSLRAMGVRATTAVPKSVVLVGWYTDLMVAIAIGAVILVIIAILTLVTLRSERRSAHAEAALKTMTERLNLAFEGSNDGVWDWNTVEDSAYYSPRWCALLGYRADEIAPLPQSWMDLLHPEDKPSVCDAIQRHLNGQQAVYSEVHRMRRKTGDWLWVESRGKALQAADGRTYRMVGTMTDIEDKKRQELALLAARDEAETANRTKSEFLAVMSHEIRTPMSGVLGMATVLLGTALTTKQRRFAELIKSSGESLLAILNDILDFSKLEAGQLNLEAIDFYLDREIEAVLRLMEPQASAKQVALRFDDRTGRRIAVNGDPTRLRQILINLIGNAIKFTEVGTVTLRCGARSRADERVEITFEVIDTGIGMAEDQRRKLFQKFSQGDPSIARRYGGTGLGLAIIRQLTNLMDGTITVESQPDVGSRFCVSVSLAKATEVPRESPETLPAQNRPALANLRVLAAEDNTINQVILHELLSPHVAELKIVADGESAIRAADTELYDVVLMDVRLPGIDGIDAAKTIRDLGPEWRHRPIIALTANAMSAQQDAYLEAGMTACLSKPIDVEQLFDALTEIAARSTNLDSARVPSIGANARGSDNAANDASRNPTPDEAMEATPVLVSESGLDQLTEIIGPDSVAALLGQLSIQFRDSIAQIADAADDPQILGALAHTLAGAAGNCQAVHVSKSARALETAIGANAPYDDRLAQLTSAIELTLPAIAATVSRLETGQFSQQKRVAIN